MKDEILRIGWLDENGDKHDWIVVGHYDDPKHPNRKYCYREGSPSTTWFDDAKDLQEVLAYLWKYVINSEPIVSGKCTIVVEKA